MKLPGPGHSGSSMAAPEAAETKPELAVEAESVKLPVTRIKLRPKLCLRSAASRLQWRSSSSLLSSRVFQWRSSSSLMSSRSAEFSDFREAGKKIGES